MHTHQENLTDALKTKALPGLEFNLSDRRYHPESKIFVSTHPAVAYYASALALYRFESFMRKKVLDAKYGPFKYHLLAIVRIMTVGDEMPPMSSN